MSVEGSWALVTGASSGLGVDFAHLLAEKKMNLVITARRAERLEEVAATVRDRYGVEVRVIPGDLSTPEMCDRLFAETEDAGIPITVLINNAGFGTQHPFADTEWERVNRQLQLNMVSLTRLTWLWGRAMADRGRGWIMNVASIGAYLPAPGYATYTAGKAYVRNFTEAAAEELRPRGVVLSSLCPGPTRTEFMDAAGHELAQWQEKFMMSSRKCAEIGIKGLFNGSPNVVAGWSNKAMMASLRLLPRRAMTLLAGKAMG